MKGRPKSIRKISFMPAVSGFKPYGGNADQSKAKGIYLFYEEYESLRLSDYEHHTQCESAALMGVSRPTFTRIYQRARAKIAQAFVEGLRIIIEGGKVQLDGHWYICHSCGALFSTEDQPDTLCPLCGADDTGAYAIGDETEPIATTQSTSLHGLHLEPSSCASLRQRRQSHQCSRHGCRCQAHEDE